MIIVEVVKKSVLVVTVILLVFANSGEFGSNLALFFVNLLNLLTCYIG